MRKQKQWLIQGVVGLNGVANRSDTKNCALQENKLFPFRKKNSAHFSKLIQFGRLVQITDDEHGF
jgi:hypothetical protein